MTAWLLWLWRHLDDHDSDSVEHHCQHALDEQVRSRPCRLVAGERLSVGSHPEAVGLARVWMLVLLHRGAAAARPQNARPPQGRPTRLAGVTLTRRRQLEPRIPPTP